MWSRCTHCSLLLVLFSLGEFHGLLAVLLDRLTEAAYFRGIGGEMLRSAGTLSRVEASIQFGKLG